MENSVCMGVRHAENDVAEYGDIGRKLVPKKEKDSRITELEQQLAIAENRCTTLRKQVEYMRLLYDGVEKPVENSEGLKNNDDKRGDSHFFPEKLRTKCIPEANVFNEKFLSDFNEGFVSEITGSKQHVGKDPKDVVQIILSGMTRSINDISEPELQIKPCQKPVPKKPETTNKQKSLKGKIKHDDKKIDKTPPKKINKKETSGDKKPVSRQAVKSNKTAPPKQKKMVKPLKATKPTVYKKNPEPIQLVPERETPMPILPAAPSIHTLPAVKEDLNRRRSKSSCEHVKSTYQLPTVSYRMKCVPKSLNAHFNIKSIPFVVGMSTNKSHNLGMKVQETLSLIKLNNRSAISQTALGDPDSELGGILKYCPSQIPFSAQQTRSRYVVRHGSLGNMKKPGTLLQAKASSVSMGTTVDYKNYQLRNVLVNLHDEFSKMTIKYDQLKDTSKSKKDSEADKELQKLEEELTTKENEINAIMGLYNEVQGIISKKQVSNLKDKLTYMEKRTSSTSLFARNESFTRSVSSNGLKMTRLLRKIEEFQDSLKGNAFI